MMPTDQDKPWFAPKRYGYGAGLPIAWQGWVVLGGYVAIIAVAVGLLSPVARWVAIIAATAGLIVICAKKTAGGWRWRNGS